MLLVLMGCGPGVRDSDGGASGDRGSGARPSTSGADASASDTGGLGGTTEDAGGSTTSTADDTSPGTTAATPTGTTGPDEPIGQRCGDAPPVVRPPTPDGCEPVWFVDAEGAPIVGAHSGFVQCFSEGRVDYVVYQTAKVACPELLGAQCLCDADCPSQQQCVCANELTHGPGLGPDPENRCYPSDCESADDCAEGECRFDIGDCVGAWLPEALRCTTDADDCTYDSECTNFCNWDEVEELFTCNVGAICE